VALTLSPALSAIILRRGRAGYRRGPLGWFASILEKTRNGYGHIVGFLVRFWIVPLAALGACFLGAYLLFARLPATFLPDEDQGALFVDIQLPAAASLDRTRAIVDEVQQTLRATAVVENVIAVAGFSILQGTQSPNGAMLVAALQPWDQRGSSEV